MRKALLALKNCRPEDALSPGRKLYLHGLHVIAGVFTATMLAMATNPGFDAHLVKLFEHYPETAQLIGGLEGPRSRIHHLRKPLWSYMVCDGEMLTYGFLGWVSIQPLPGHLEDELGLSKSQGENSKIETLSI